MCPSAAGGPWTASYQSLKNKKIKKAFQRNEQESLKTTEEKLRLF